jgi:hypothetical protein
MTWIGKTYPGANAYAGMTTPLAGISQRFENAFKQM